MVGIELSNFLKQGWIIVTGRPTVNDNKKACQYGSINWLPLAFLQQFRSLCRQLGNSFCLFAFSIQSLLVRFPCPVSYTCHLRFQWLSFISSLFILALSNVLYNLNVIYCFLNYLAHGSQHPFMLPKTLGKRCFGFHCLLLPPPDPPLKRPFELHSSNQPDALGIWVNKGQMGAGKEKILSTLLGFVAGPEN